ncbi:unnamed protein product [Cylicocyclus nassatus]|uniref:DUF4440 domain-containing protein n=1 Tax=Cylicocyclus nassatus TaxID=53992 RepID=A0AA36H679_CYLNA|nr:unnamed protein product [Cylicocyclus nassatus]
MGSSEEAKSIVKPLLEQLFKYAQAQDFEKVSDFYDPNGVLVHTGKDAVYGRDALKKAFEEFMSRAGKITPKISDEDYHMAGDFIIYTSAYETETEKMGIRKGKVTQIWRKSGDTYRILHIEDAQE